MHRRAFFDKSNPKDAVYRYQPPVEAGAAGRNRPFGGSGREVADLLLVNVDVMQRIASSEGGLGGLCGLAVVQLRKFKYG